MAVFTHLHVHSEFSLLDGAARIRDLVLRARELGMTSLALTDHGVMYGAIPFYKACKEQGIKPIIGCEFYITAGSLKDRGNRGDHPVYHLILLAKNETGYKHMMKLCSIGHLEGHHYKPRIDHAVLREHAEGIIALSACIGGEIPRHILAGQDEWAYEAALRYKDIFGADFYLEMQDHGLLEQKKVNLKLAKLSERTGIPLVVTNDVHYLHQADHAVQDVLICIGTGKTMADADRMRFHTDQLYLKSAEEMAELFAPYPQALAATETIADACRLELDFGHSILPEFFPIPEGKTAEQYLHVLCEQGLSARYGEKYGEGDGEVSEAEAKERLLYELSVIARMGYADYFLIVWDFIRFAREQHIMVGPGRGSSAGSLVAYVLGITDIDPIRFGLLFERFLNPERVSMPDIDIDFSDERRDEVIAYVVDKYGSNRVAQIITFGTMAAKAAVRDVGRVLGMPYQDVDRVAKMIPSHPGVTIEKALLENADLRKLYEQSPQTAKLIDHARQVEGMPRHASTHAAGVVISKRPLTEYVPLQAGTEKIALTQYTMEHLESIGLLKMDFLGLRNLSIIERALAWIEQLYGQKLALKDVPLTDARTFDMLGRGDTAGVFQLESVDMRKVLRAMQPSRFEEIISVLALYRPGPMDFIPQYISSKHDRTEIVYPHPDLRPILEDTYGIIVYQEQIMQIASKMAGFSLGEADLLRRAVSKKKREVLDEERMHFVKGSLNLGYTEEEADRVYDMIVRFASYGFGRAHAAAYAVVTYHTAYLKANYTVPFMAAMLTSVMGNHRKVAEYTDECRRMHIEVLGPDVNESDMMFTPVRRQEDGAIRFGLAAVKNVGTQAMESIIASRTERKYGHLQDFCKRVDLRVCNKRVIESLIMAGAMDELPGHRAQKLAALDETIEAAVKLKKERDELQMELFGFEEHVNRDAALPEVPPLPPGQALEMEREMLGLYLSGHPLDEYEEQLGKLGTVPMHQLGEIADGRMVTVAGRVLSIKRTMTKKGQAMAFLNLEDRIDRVEAVVFPAAWSTCKDWLDKGTLLYLKAKVQHSGVEDSVKLLAEELKSLDQLFLPQSAKVYIKIAADKEEPALLLRLQHLLKAMPGTLPVILYYERSGKTLALSEQYRVNDSPELQLAIERLLGKDSAVMK